MTFMKLALATLRSEARIEIDPAQPYQQGFFFAVMYPEKIRVRFSLRTP